MTRLTPFPRLQGVLMSLTAEEQRKVAAIIQSRTFLPGERLLQAPENKMAKALKTGAAGKLQQQLESRRQKKKAGRASLYFVVNGPNQKAVAEAVPASARIAGGIKSARAQHNVPGRLDALPHWDGHTGLTFGDGSKEDLVSQREKKVLVARTKIETLTLPLLSLSKLAQKQSELSQDGTSKMGALEEEIKRIMTEGSEKNQRRGSLSSMSSLSLREHKQRRTAAAPHDHALDEHNDTENRFDLAERVQMIKNPGVARAFKFSLNVRALPGWLSNLSAISVFHSKSILYDAFVWARGALNRHFRRFPARAG